MDDNWRLAAITIVGVLASIAAAALATEAYVRLAAKRLDVRGKHCYVTGGSQGLGKAIAVDLARRGAHVTIAARREAVLREAVAEIKKEAQDAASQRIEYVVADVAKGAEAAREAVDEAEAKQRGRPVDVLFAVAGVSVPGMFVEQEAAQLTETMRVNYDGTVCAVHEVARRMVRGGIRGRIVLVSSTLGMFGLVGYAGYCASKFAIRGLAEALRIELRPHQIAVHCYFPGTIFTPGYDAENLTKPQITKDIEGADDGLPPHVCSRRLLRGIERGEFAVCSDPISMMFRCATRGAMPNNNAVVDSLVAAVAWVALVPWRLHVDYLVNRAASAAASARKAD
ncbi:3-dehydrosphinganine reductase [Coemansia sp. RSA 1939]|nr:3-dehydrosphinganine reductase [Coemansia sp. RSA 1939]KAJ2610130.1 3-dehydrosphinganine reductase [Coemansia sp. RSA 1804]